MMRIRMLALFALVAALAAEALYRGGALNPVDQRLQDAWFQWQGPRAEARHVVIVGVDEDTLAAYPDDPMVFWTDRLARAVGRLQEAGARVVGLDMLLSISPERWLGKLGGELQRAARDYDRPFREAVNTGRLVLVATRTGSGERESDYLLPSPDYLLALPNFDIPGHIALGDLLDEGDGVIRRYLVGPVAATGVRLPESGVPAMSLPALLAVRAAGLDPAAGEWALAGFAAFGAGVLAPVAAHAAATGLVLLGVLGWRLTGEERERARVRQMFGRYVSDQVVEALLRTGNRPELGGQSQAVTVLFSDIRNFTTMSERLNAKEVVEMLNTYFERACVPLLAEGGSIDKFIGDAIMVEFGSPLPIADHALRAVRAALALRGVAEEFAGWVERRFPGRCLPKFAVGIGLHSGEAVIGSIGSPACMEFTAIGDTVNLASRLEGMTKQLGCTILGSETTVAAAGAAVACGRSEVVAVKGRAAPVKVFEILGLKEGVGDA
jgi:class 3 adenylate cyclase